VAGIKREGGVASAEYRWYLGAQVLSLFGTMMGYTALFWLVLHIRHGGAPALAAVDAAQTLPMLLFSRRAGTIVARLGLFGTFIAVGGIAGNSYSSRRRDPGPLEFLAWAVVFGVAECLAAVMPVVWAYDAALVVLGAATQLFAVSATVYLQQATPAAQRAHALSAYNAGFIGFVPAGAFAVAAIASAAGTRWALIGPGLAIVTCGVALTVRQTRAIRRA